MLVGVQTTTRVSHTLSHLGIPTPARGMNRSLRTTVGPQVEVAPEIEEAMGTRLQRRRVVNTSTMGTGVAPSGLVLADAVLLQPRADEAVHKSQVSEVCVLSSGDGGDSDNSSCMQWKAPFSTGI
mmetsp:Transcript_7629/g.11075  ORF Transcript_7629/g.11075 Transcript_7629/m.11075 type:complete len:125 (+) Transcript_7629:236-610(+)